MGQKQQVARVVLLLSCGVAMVCGLVMMALGIWTVNDKMFLDELLRNRLYVDTAYIILVAATSITVLSCFGCFAAMREIRCFLLAYFLALLLLTVILAVAGVISYVFREQVEWTMRAEMLTKLRGYGAGEPGDSVTLAWDLTQEQLQCCGLLTEKVEEPWQMWRYSKTLNPSPPPSPGQTVLPPSCCRDGREAPPCLGSSPSLHPGDCFLLALTFLQQHAATLGTASVAVAALMVPGLISSFLLFQWIV